MTSTVFFNIFTGWRATDNVTIKAFMIISGKFRTNFAILLITFTRRRRLLSFLLFSTGTSLLVGVLYLGFHPAKRLQFLQL